MWYQRHKKQHKQWSKGYIKTYFGKLHKMYSNAQQRILGQDKKRLWYKGLPICSREEFYRFAEQSAYKQLYEAWVKSDYCLRLTPTIDRLDNEKGYTLDNIEIVTHSENTKRRSLSCQLL